MWQRGRGASNRSLTNAQVIEMREMAAQGRDLAFIANHFNANISTARSAISGHRYVNVGGPLKVFAKKKRSRFIGVSPTRDGKWEMRLTVRGVTYRFVFGFEVDAACCYNAHVAYLGLGKSLNVIPEGEWCHD